jgi:predicted nucleic acid-binding protein
VDHVVSVIDAQPLVAFIRREEGWERIGHTISEALAGRRTLRLTAVNAGEVTYGVERSLGAVSGHRALVAVQAWTEIVAVDLELASRAGWLKLRGGISFADCFAAALAHRDGIPLITGDPEFRRVEDVIAISWLGAP